MIDLTYHNFGRLTVIGRDFTKPSGNGKPIFWKCICECGNEVSVNGHSLRKGITNSCGCYRKEKSIQNGSKRLNNLTGQKFGKLTVIERAEDYVSPKGHHIVQWKCKCDCGQETIVTSYRLTHNETSSCGCIRSKGEEKIIKILTENNIPFET